MTAVGHDVRGAPGSGGYRDPPSCAKPQWRPHNLGARTEGALRGRPPPSAALNCTESGHRGLCCVP